MSDLYTLPALNCDLTGEKLLRGFELVIVPDDHLLVFCSMAPFIPAATTKDLISYLNIKPNYFPKKLY